MEVFQANPESTNQRSVGIDIYKNGRDTIQKMTNDRRAGAVIAALAGSASRCQLMNDGQIA
jgi:hypothetical protein